MPDLPPSSPERLQRYAADLAFPCPVAGCGACPGEPCGDVPDCMVHTSRRLRRLESDLERRQLELRKLELERERKK